MARGKNNALPNQQSHQVFEGICAEIRKAGLTPIHNRTGVSFETLRRYLNGITVSVTTESRILDGTKIILEERANGRERDLTT